VAGDEYADGKIDARRLERITARLRPQIEAAEAIARVVDDCPLLEGLAGNEQVPALSEQLPLTRKRAVIDVLMTIRVMPTRQGARYFDPESVEIIWKQQ
jgi:site-specific DNA recombinase